MQRVNPPTVGECKRCGKWAKSITLALTICDACYMKESKAQCGKCGRERRFVSENGGLCLQCSERASPAIEIACRECGKIRPPAIRGSEYCHPCRQRIRRTGICSLCRREGRYWSSIKRLCKRCGRNESAARLLTQFVETLDISNEYNRFVFEQLVSITDRATVTEEIRQRIVETGTFLQSHEIQEPLSWRTIRELDSKLSGAQYRVREGLQHLAEHLLGPDVDQVDPSAAKELALIDRLPASVRPIAQQYSEWLRNERKDTDRVRLTHLRTLNRFWRCCRTQGVTCLANVTAEHVEEFLYVLNFRWKCRECSSTKNLSGRGEAPPSVCENSSCAASGCFDKVVRCLPVSLSGYRAQLRIFFGWLKEVEHGIQVNPAPSAGKKKKKGRWNAPTHKSPRTIQYYDRDIIDALLNAIEINALEANMPSHHKNQTETLEYWKQVFGRSFIIG